jgi:hypothetical protein
MYSGEYDACDVTLSVYPHRASLKNMPGHGIEDICVRVNRYMPGQGIEDICVRVNRYMPGHGIEDIFLRVNRYMPGQGIEDICVRVKADGVSCKFLDYLSIILRTFMK